MPFSFPFQVLSGNWLIGGEGVSLSCFSIGRKPKGSWHPFTHCAGERSWPIHYLEWSQKIGKNATQGFIHTPSPPSSPSPNQDILRRGTKSDTSFEVLQGNSFHRSPWDSTLAAGAQGCHVSVWEMTLTAPQKKSPRASKRLMALYKVTRLVANQISSHMIIAEFRTFRIWKNKMTTSHSHPGAGVDQMCKCGWIW